MINFDELAAHYEAWYQTPLGNIAHTLEQEAIFALAEVKPGDRVVDIGCGTGLYTLDLARRGAHVIGIDPSMEMLTLAREKCRRAGLKAYFVCGSVEALPFRSQNFDLALAVTSLCFVRSPVRAVEEIYSVLKPGGHLVIGELNGLSLWAFLRRLKGLFTDTIYNQVHFWNRRELEKLLQQKGFCLSAARTLLHFPPINQKIFLKSHRFFEATLKKLLPGTGAFLAIKAERR